MEDQLKVDLAEEILRKGWTGIYKTDSSWREDRRGEDEYTTRTYVYQQGGKYYQSIWTRHQVIRPYKSYEDNRSWGEAQEITLAEYDHLRTGKDQIDTPKNRANLDKLKEKLRKEREKELAKQKATQAVIPNCPKCNKKMARRDGPYGKFWGCARYPKCKGTRK